MTKINGNLVTITIYQKLYNKTGYLKWNIITDSLAKTYRRDLRLARAA